jgi:M6 family metalloprotease-like protein
MSNLNLALKGLRQDLLRNGLLLLFVLCLFAGDAARAQTLASFGYRRMTVAGTPAIGSRPLAVILMQYDGSPSFAHPASYYDDLIFNPFKNSVNGYFLENSQGRFHWSRAGAGMYGPFNYAASQYGTETNGKFSRLYLALQGLADAGLDFTQYDSNHDGFVTSNELSVFAIDNKLTAGGVNRGTDPDTFHYTNPVGKQVSVKLSVATVGQRSSFMVINHELSHQLGTIEMYGESGNENCGFTLMGCTLGLDDMTSFHLDPWHKMMLGWVEPRFFSIDSAGNTTISAPQVLNEQSPVILYSPAKGFFEFYILEFRTNIRAGGGKYDGNVGASSSTPRAGLVIWHVKTKGIGGENVNGDVEVIDAYDLAGKKMISVFMVGSPSFTRGLGDVWTPGGFLGAGVVPYPLKWLDGFGPSTKLKVDIITSGGDLLHVSWGDFSEVPPTPAEKLFIYSSSNLSATTGAINPTDNSFTTLQLAFGPFSYWTHVVGDGVDLLFYDSKTGGAAIGQVDAKGQFTTTFDRRPGYFIPGWTHVVRHKGYYLFYNSQTGAAVVGNFGTAGFQPYNSWKDFSPGWTQIVSTNNGLLFYNTATGAGFVGEWSFIKSGAGFGTIAQVNLNRLWAGSFTTGWTHAIDTSNGVLFYCTVNGRTAVADVNTDGSVTTRPKTDKSISPGWTSIVSDRTHLLFYNATSGDVAVGSIRKFSVFDVSISGGSPRGLDIQRVFPRYFSPGWTNIVSTMDPPQL